MPEKQISDLPLVTLPVDDTAILHLIEGATNNKVTYTSFLDDLSSRIIPAASDTVAGIVQLDLTWANDDTKAASSSALYNYTLTAGTQFALKTTDITAGDGLTGGGDLSSPFDVTIGTPSTLTTATTNGVTATSHTHAVTFPVESVAGKTGAVVLDYTTDITNLPTVILEAPIDGSGYVREDGAWVAESTGMANPMTTLKDLIVGGASGAPARLAAPVAAGERYFLNYEVDTGTLSWELGVDGYSIGLNYPLAPLETLTAADEDGSNNIAVGLDCGAYNGWRFDFGQTTLMSATGEVQFTMTNLPTGDTGFSGHIRMIRAGRKDVTFTAAGWTIEWPAGVPASFGSLSGDWDYLMFYTYPDDMLIRLTMIDAEH